MLNEFIFDIAKIVEGAVNSDIQKVASYTKQLADRLEAAGELEAAKRVRRILSGSSVGAVGLLKHARGSAAALPVDSESRLPVADVEMVQAGECRPVLPEAARQTVERFLTYFRSAGELLAHGVGVSPSMLVYGPPGTGKTLLARHIAGELSLPLVTARTDSLISSYLGSTSKNLRQLFDHAASRPCVLFLDEFDALAKMRDDGREMGELKRVVISLLQNIDALGPDHVLIAATNHEHLLDPAIWRRFQYKLRLSEPDAAAREQLLAAFFGRFANPYLVGLIAAMTEGVSGAQLRQIAEDGVREAVVAKRAEIDLPTVIRSALAANPKTAAAARLPLVEQMKALRAMDRKTFTQSLLATMFNVSQPWVCQLLRDKE